MKNLKCINCVALTPLESQQINGGTDSSKTSVWEDISFFGISIVRGLAVFGTEGGRNAGICVR